ncbi:MAG: Dabb family protein [Verrucomicrobia bacterium]|nr:Dabb family protein [Verrucomicrobiota bacterium]MDA1005656.1 Dabb family protein [Verrucomicrobiota bacterium]
MKTIALILALTMTTILSASADHHEEKKSSFRHVVCLKFKEDATPGQIQSVEKGFAALPSKIDTITGLDWGTNVSEEDRAKGFTHCFIVSFATKEGLAVYLPHEAHQAFVKELRPILDDVFVIDFDTK